MLTSVTVTLESGAITVVIASTYGAPSEWYLGVTGPYGEIKAKDLLVPDAVGTNPTINVVLSDPLDDGDYTFSLTVYPNAVELNAVTVEQEFCMERSQTLAINVTDDCEDLTVEDATAYPTIDALVRQHTIQYPIIAGVTPSPDLISSSSQLVLNMVQSDGLIYENVTWIVTTDVSGTFSHTVGVWEFIYPNEYDQSVVNHEVICSLDLCSAVTCVEQAWATLIDDACSRGGISRLPPGQLEKMLTLLGHLSMYAHFVNCNNTAKAREYYDKIVDLTNVACSPSTAPRPITTTPAVGLGWTAFPVDAYGANYTLVVGQELSWRLEGRIMYFRGEFDGNAFSSSGLELIKASYFSGIGITLVDNLRTPILDIATGGPVPGPGYVRVLAGAINVYSTAGIDPSHNHAIGGILLIE